MRTQLALVLLAVFSFFSSSALAVENGFCENFQLEEIPVGNFHQPLVMPMNPMRITQEYHTSEAEGYCQAPGQPSGDSPLCEGYQIYYGHDGLDLHPLGAAAGVEDIYSIQNGLVVASHPSGSFSGWGESLIIATRANAYSEEVLTFHYHHLYNGGGTSRLYGRCEVVEAGAAVAKEGGTPNWPTHLHLSIKRWRNLQELQNKIANSPNGFYGPGYTFGDDSKVANYLDPEGMLYNYFTEFEENQSSFPTWQWSEEYVRAARAEGWFFGNFDGSFGVDQVIKRREAARWVKTALRLENQPDQSQHFNDVSETDQDFSYINALVKQQLAIPVINPSHSCSSPGVNFCPEQSLTRAEALKMIIAGFYQDQFLDLYNNWVWQAAAPLANNLLSHFSDVGPWEWYAPYVYFAWQKGLTGGGAVFNPGLPIRRAELAKWLVLAAQEKFGGNQNFCMGLNCPYGDYCDQTFQTCLPIPECLPAENQNCELGGGYDPNNAPDLNAQCEAGQEELKLCPDNQTASYHVCLINNQWSAWNPPCPENGNEGTGGSAGSGGEGGTGGSGGADGGSGGSGGSPPECQISYHLSPNGASCYNNPAGSGSPTLCLETFQGSGPSVSWRLCKQGSTFQNSFEYQLLDQNHLSQNLGGVQNGNAGSACTNWQSADFSYLDQNGPANGAGLIVEVHSPGGCALPACTYYTGITTFYRQCQ